MVFAYLESGGGFPWGTVVAVVVVAVIVALVVLLFRHLWRSERGSRTPPPAPDPLDRLNQLAALRDRGAVSDEEYESEKGRILGPS